MVCLGIVPLALLFRRACIELQQQDNETSDRKQVGLSNLQSRPRSRKS